MASSHQKGFALAAAMMVLALLSVLGAAAIQSTTLEVKISAHDRDARAALYLAESAIEEARYYASRGWGKITDHLPNQVRVETVMPTPPGFSWDGSRYVGFTLVDENGDRFAVTSHTSPPPPPAGVSPVITYTPDAGSPASPHNGRFVLVRQDFPATWDGARLVVADADAPGWAAVSGMDTWKGWLLWNAAGNSYKVQGSDTTVANEVRLELTTDPGAGPFTLSLNPWLAALDAGVTVPEDTDTGTSEWDRTFAGVGDGQVTARRITSGSYRDTYEITAVGIVTWGGVNREREVAVRVYNAGRPDQRVGDWVVVR